MYETDRCIGFSEELIEVIKGSHDGTQYVARTRKGESRVFELKRSLKEGCPLAPVQFSVFHSNAMFDFKNKAVVAIDELGVKCMITEPEVATVGRQRRMPTEEKMKVMRIFELMLADDTNLVDRKSRQKQFEELLEEVLQDWSEKVHPAKYERLLTTGEKEKGFVDAARFLGAWAEARGKHTTDTEKRLKKAEVAWRQLYKQVGRIAVDDKSLGLLASMTVIATMLFRCESRAFLQNELKRYRVFTNKVMGLCAADGDEVGGPSHGARLEEEAIVCLRIIACGSGHYNLAGAGSKTRCTVFSCTKQAILCIQL